MMSDVTSDEGMTPEEFDARWDAGEPASVAVNLRRGLPPTSYQMATSSSFSQATEWSTSVETVSHVLTSGLAESAGR